VGFLIDIAMVVVIGVAVLKAFETMWEIHKIISSATTRNDLDRAAKMLAGVVISLGIGTFLAIVTRGALKSRFRTPPSKSAKTGGGASAGSGSSAVPVKKRGETEPLKKKGQEKRKDEAKKPVVHDYDQLAKDATHNPDSKTVYLGRGNKDGVSYVDSAKADNATYFEPKDWDGLVKQMDDDPDKIFQVNQKFLEQQIEAGKTIKFTHPPDASSGGFYYQQELEFLKDLGYSFVKDGNSWKAVPGG